MQLAMRALMKSQYPDKKVGVARYLHFQYSLPELSLRREQLSFIFFLAVFHGSDDCWCTNVYSMLFT